MIPCPAPTLLSANPHFEALHAKLIKDVLDSDASTRSINISNQPASGQLRTHRIDITRDRFLTSSLFDLSIDDSLPPDLRELILIIASYISTASGVGLSQHEDDLLSEDIEKFKHHSAEISDLLSQRLISQHNLLKEVAVVSQDSIFESKIPSLGIPPAGSGQTTRAHRRKDTNQTSLSDIVDSQLSRLDHLQTRLLPTTLYDTINTLISLLHAQTEHLQHIIRYLEQRKHGTDSRHLVTKAHFLSTVAQGLEAKMKVSYLEQRRDLYSPKLVGRLGERMSELDEEEDALERRKKELQEALREYDEAGLDIMRTLGRKYGEIEREIKEIKDDVERLGR